MSQNTHPCEANNEDDEICNELVRIFGNRHVKPEWDACVDAITEPNADDLRRRGRSQGRYCPKIDFAIGPFNRSRRQNDIDAANVCYNRLVSIHDRLLTALDDTDRYCERTYLNEISSDEEWQAYTNPILNMERESELVKNLNPRCFIAAEIERATSEKHILGGIVHASALGKVGIVITPDDDVGYGRIMRIRRYLRFLVAVGKAGESVTFEKNVILLRRSDLLDVLRGYEPDNIRTTRHI